MRTSVTEGRRPAQLIYYPALRLEIVCVAGAYADHQPPNCGSEQPTAGGAETEPKDEERRCEGERDREPKNRSHQHTVECDPHSLNRCGGEKTLPETHPSQRSSIFHQQDRHRP